MTMKKVLLLLLLLTAVGMTGLKAQNSLTVTLADGTQHVYQLSERPEMLWEGDNVIISTATTELTVPRANFKGFSVSNESAIKAFKNGGSRITISGDGQLLAEGLKAGTMLSIYDAAGRLLSQQTIAVSGRATVNLSHQPKGSYLVKIDHQPTLKILKP